jgi:hypothetical protein
VEANYLQTVGLLDNTVIDAVFTFFLSHNKNLERKWGY